MSEAILCSDLNVSYKGKGGTNVHAVQGLSFAIQPGECVGFLGPNGAGKSSTLKALMGFLTPTSGNCSILGMRAGTPEAKRKIGYLPEVALYYPYLTPLETLCLYGELQGLRGKPLKVEATELLEVVGLSGSIKKQNRHLSKGMLQRVGIAQSLLGNPEVLILDEVTSGLDPVGRRELRTLLREKQKNGSTLFFSSHELSEVDMLCDRLLLIANGKLIDQQNMPELKCELKRFEVEYEGAVSLTGLTVEWNQLDRDRFRATLGSQALLIEALDRIHKEDGKVLDVVSQDGSLEDYFVQKVAA